MESHQKTGRVIGFLLLLITAAGIPSVIFRGLSTSMASSPNFLDQVFQNSMQMRFAMLLNITASGLWIVAAVILFPLIKKYNEKLALAFFGIWMVYFSIIIFGNISHLSLLSLSQEYTTTEISNNAYFNIHGLLKIEDYFWAHFFSIMLYASAAFIFYYFLFRTKLVPQLLSAWGMIAISLVFVACWLNIFDKKVSFYFFSQNGLHMIILTGWLIAKGFKPHKIERNTH